MPPSSGCANGDWVTLGTARAEVSGRALVTRRMRPFVLDGVTRHHVAASYHYGRKGLVTGDPLNELFALSGEPNTTIQGSKVVSVAVRPGRSTSRPQRGDQRAAGARPRRHRRTCARDLPEVGAARGRAARVRRTRVEGRRTRGRPLMGTKGFFTDTSVCIGCKACEVACKQWNDLPDDGMTFTGMSYDNTGMLNASSWRHVKFLERPVPLEGVTSTPGRLQLADDERQLQALRHGLLPGGVPHGRDRAHRVRVHPDPARRVQRVRLLQRRLPVRGRRQAARRRPQLEVHHVLRPAGGRLRAGLRQVVPDRSRSSSATSTSSGSAPTPAWPTCRSGGWPPRGCTATTPPASRAPTGCTRSTCCSTSRPPTACPTSRWRGRVGPPTGWRSMAASGLAVGCRDRRRGPGRTEDVVSRSPAS